MINKYSLISLANRIVAEPGLGHSSIVVNPWESDARYPRFLRQLMQEQELKVAVECGVYLGISTEYMILSSNDSFVIGIDWELRMENIGPIYDRHPKNVVFLNADTTAAGNRVCELLDGKTIDLLFLDSTHDGVTPKKEFEQYKPLFSDTAIVVCDDIGGADMQDFWNWLPGEKAELNNLHLSYGASVGFGASIVKK